MFIHWDTSLETGQTLIDAEHRILVFLFRKLDVAVKTGESLMAVNQVIGETKHFVEFHFASEENLMRETNYPHLAAHQAQHQDLLAKLGVLASKVIGRREFPEDLLYFLNNWLVEHIANHDQRVALHVRDAVARPIAEHAYGEYINFNVGSSTPK
jgi:hemerythrin-like metal-binding protein